MKVFLDEQVPRIAEPDLANRLPMHLPAAAILQSQDHKMTDPQFRRGRGTLRAHVVLLNAILVWGCTGDRPTEPESGRAGDQTSAIGTCTDCMIDNFTDANGTLLESHVPDGGSTPFRWTRLTNAAAIKDNSISADPLPGSSSWAYTTSQTAGDWVELDVDVFADPMIDTTYYSITILLHHPTGGVGYRVVWTICGMDWCGGGGGLKGHLLDILDANGPGSHTHISQDPVSVGLHTFRAEVISGSTVRASIDGMVIATYTYATPSPVDLAGIQLYVQSGVGSKQEKARITSFRAGLPPCPPSGDSVLDSKAVRDGLIAGLTASGPNLPFLQRAEHGGIIYQDTTNGSYTAVDIPNAHTGPRVTCGYDLPRPLPPGPPNGRQIAIWHTHPHFPNDTAYNCNPQDPVTNAVPYPVDPRPNGGGSSGDWNTTNTMGFPGYIINKLGEIVRLDVGVDSTKWKLNTNRWAIGSDPRACLTKSSLYVGL